MNTENLNAHTIGLDERQKKLLKKWGPPSTYTNDIPSSPSTGPWGWAARAASGVVQQVRQGEGAGAVGLGRQLGLRRGQAQFPAGVACDQSQLRYSWRPLDGAHAGV